MVDKILYPQPVKPVSPAKKAAKPAAVEKPGQAGFQELLESQLAASGLKFSAHAQQRLTSRNIQLTQGDLAKISRAVNLAAQKGARDSLIMMDRLALVVSVKNRTVVTAMDEAGSKEHVFTNIDSAVIV